MAQPAPSNISPDSAFLLAAGLMVFAAVLNAIDTLLVRVISQEMSAFAIAFFRSAFGLLFVLPWILRRRALIFRTNYIWLHAVSRCWRWQPFSMPSRAPTWRR